MYISYMKFPLFTMKQMFYKMFSQLLRIHIEKEPTISSTLMGYNRVYQRTIPVFC
jgi:hypothetical protein